MSPRIRAWFDATAAAKAVVSLLFLVGLWVAFSYLRSNDLVGFVTFLPALAIFCLLVVGVFRDAMDSIRWQAALWTTVVGWGLVDYFVAGEGWWALLIAFVGLLMLVNVFSEIR